MNTTTASRPAAAAAANDAARAEQIEMLRNSALDFAAGFAPMQAHDKPTHHQRRII